MSAHTLLRKERARWQGLYGNSAEAYRFRDSSYWPRGGVQWALGRIVPIVDMRIKSDRAKPDCDQFTVVIILNVARRVVGMVVDSASVVLRFSGEQIREAPQFGASLAAYITRLAAGQLANGGLTQIPAFHEVES